MIGTVFDKGGRPVRLFDGAIDDLRIYNRSLDDQEIRLLSTARRLPPFAWQWSSETIKSDWTTVEIDITAFCDDATRYLVEFKPTGGQNTLQIKSVIPLFDGREAPEFIERVGPSNRFYVTIPGLGMPLGLRAVLRGQGGTDTTGAVFIRKRP